MSGARICASWLGAWHEIDSRDRPWTMPSPADTAAIVRAGSLSKLVVALVALRLADRGAIDLEAPVDSLLEEASDHCQGLTPSALLAHTAGIPPVFALRRPRRPSDIVGVGLLPVQVEPARIRRDCIPQLGWAYSNFSATILAAVIERATGGPFADVARVEVFGPLGMRYATYSGRLDVAPSYECLAGLGLPVPRRPPRPSPASGLVLSLRDLTRLVAGILAEDFLSKRSRELLREPAPSAYGPVPFSALCLRIHWSPGGPWSWHGGQHLGFSHFVAIDFDGARAFTLTSFGRSNGFHLRKAGRTYIDSIGQVRSSEIVGGQTTRQLRDLDVAFVQPGGLLHAAVSRSALGGRVRLSTNGTTWQLVGRTTLGRRRLHRSGQVIATEGDWRLLPPASAPFSGGWLRARVHDWVLFVESPGAILVSRLGRDRVARLPTRRLP